MRRQAEKDKELSQQAEIDRQTVLAEAASKLARERGLRARVAAIGGAIALILALFGGWEAEVAQKKQMLAEDAKVKAVTNFCASRSKPRAKIFSSLKSKMRPEDVPTSVALKLLDNIREEFGNLPPQGGDQAADVDRVRLFDAMSKSYIALGLSKKAIDSAQIAVKLSQNITGGSGVEWSRAQADGYRNLGDAFRLQGKFVEASDAYRSALETWRRLAEQNGKDILPSTITLLATN